MGYAITIKRDADRISYEEWLRLARADVELTGGEFSEWNAPDGTVRYEVFSWQRPGAQDGEGTADFVYYDGRVMVDHVHESWPSKIASVAAKLNAQAIGDDGEVYDVTGTPIYPPRPPKPPWWKRVLGRT